MPVPTHTSRTSSPSPSIEKSPTNESKEQPDKEEKDSSTTTMDNNPSPPSIITIRRAKLKDSQTLGTILAAGFIDDDVFGEYLFPHRREYPDDYRLQFARTMRSHMYKRGHRVRVAVDSSTSRVIGVASWERQERKRTSKSTTTTEEEKRSNDNNNSVCVLFKHVAIQSLDAISSIIHPDRSASVENKRTFDAEVPNYKHYWSGSRSETWYLSFLAVDAEYRGCGAGRALVEEGIRWGETDGVCVSLISTECGDGFYRRLGFVDVGSATEGALKGLRGGNIKFYERHLENSEEEGEEKRS